MPEIRDAPDVQQPNLEEEPLFLSKDALGDAYALALVNQTFFQAENFRQQNHDQRWNVHSQLFYGWVPPKVWEGTNIARAHLGYQVVFDQVEAALPAISSALFDVGPQWFDVEPEPGSQPEEARAIASNLLYNLEHTNDTSGGTARVELDQAIKSTLIYGNGGIGLEWDAANRRPYVQWVDTRDLYIDPGTSTPSIDEARAVIRRRQMTIEEIYALKDNPGMSVPSKEVLYGLSRYTPIAHGDRTKQLDEGLRGVLFIPGSSEFLPLPSDRKLEILMYYSKSRIIWVINRRWVLLNIGNPYGFIPFCFAPCYQVIGRFYALSMADVQEGNQRYIEALLNRRLDYLSLVTDPPRAVKRGSLMTPAQQRWRSGAVFQYEDPSKDVQLLIPQGGVVDVFQEISFLKQSADERTGINPMMNAGVPRPSNMNRTLGGVQMQMQGASNRLQRLVKNFEDYLIVPMLYKMHRMIQVHTNPAQILPGMEGGRQVQVGAAAFQRRVRFKMLAASRMVTQQKLVTALPMIMQFLPPMMGELQKLGWTLDAEEIFEMLQDTISTGRKYRLLRRFTPEEQQSLQQQQQADARTQTEMAKAQMEAQTRLQMGQMKAETERAAIQGDLQKELIKRQPDPAESQMRMQEGRQKLMVQHALAQLKAASEMQRLQTEAAAHQQKMSHEAAQAVLKQHVATNEAGAKHLQALLAIHAANQKSAADQARIEAETQGAISRDKAKTEVEMKKASEPKQRHKEN